MGTGPATRRHLLLGAVVGLIVIVSACGDDAESDESQSATDTSAAQAIADVVDSTPIGDDADDIRYEELDTCPLDPGGALLARAVGDLDEPDVIAAGPAALVSGVDRYAAGEPAIVACDRFPDGNDSAIGLYAIEAPADLEGWARTFATSGEGRSSVQVDYVTSRTLDRGTFHHVCVDLPDDDTFTPYCEVDWVDDEILIGLYVAGPDALTADVDAMEAGLASVIPEIINNLES